ncbi:MAG: PP2C family serine/threonine-protein phosphatase [Methanospirillum sp.]
MGGISSRRPAGAWLTDRGRRRESNEDAVGADLEREVYVVADGLGGLPGGEVASRITVEMLVSALSLISRDKFLEVGIRNAVVEADVAIRRAGAADLRFAGMATTVVLAVGAEEAWVIAHVGDSRAYLFRDGRLCRLTTDHNVAAELVASGRISPAEAQHHPGRNVVTRTLGAGTPSDPDLRRVGRQPGDRLLLCTDGLAAVLDDDAIGQVLARCRTPEACCRELVALANDGGGPDNITVIVVDV